MRAPPPAAWRRASRGLAAAAVVLALGCARARAPAPAVPRYDGPVLRLLTCNVNFGIAGDRATIDAIRDARADLVVLQETNAAWERALRAALAADLPHMVFHNRGGAGGMAVLARVPLVAVDLLP